QELAPDPRQAQQPPDAEDPGRDEGDVLTRDSKEVIEPGRAEIVLAAGRHPFVLAEHDAQDDCAADTGRTTPDGTLDPVAQPVPQAGDSSATADLTPARRFEHHMDALALEPGALVEAVTRRPWLGNPNCRLENPPARRRATDRQHEEHAFTDALAPERPRHCDHARRVGRRASRCDRRALRDAALTALPDEPAPAEAIHAQRPPAEPDERNRDGDGGKPRRSGERNDRSQGEQRREACDGEWLGSPHREPDTDAPRRDEEGWPVALDDGPHGVTRSRSCSIRVGPIPGTESRSSTDENGRCSVR